MLRVPNVNATIEYWLDRGAKLQMYHQTATTEIAFVGFGERDQCFSFELTSETKTESPPDTSAIDYIGISMLSRYDFTSEKDIETLVSDKKKEMPPPFFAQESPPLPKTDPNGIPVRYVASAPGDSLAQLGLICTTDTSLSDVADFYQDIMGMEQVALDETTLCLRFTPDDDDNERPLLPTTLVFTKPTKEDKDVEHLENSSDSCFDHIVIATTTAGNLEKIEQLSGSAVFMTPKSMFGATLLGVNDPNGYKVYVMDKTPQLKDPNKTYW